ncbi:hypothetical protein GCM10011351_15950 [Paraliobacillus quinghaiensis]|uniref:Putative Flp pilus-assembly TadG-like N-terminal domain-containing protein n=1 Tax=Paraliobacillus quinghaiensis TaxID=470815 RepID=A0A917TPT1_9BACI|nr:pilus assembly protein TadG-related protein [Paraliobacillus quinghaiensis]GGM30629.1 hypothetical protein GCM10011351_15950 [Paraliobacillus quinghaiensis]
MKKIKQLFTKQNGSVLVLVAFAFTGILGMTGLAIDGGIVYMNKAELQKIANAAVLSGAQELTSDGGNVKIIAQEVIAQHDEADTLQSTDVIQTEIEQSVRVSLKKTVPHSFLKLFGVQSADVHAEAKAGLGVMGSAIGAAPLGIDESLELVYGEEYPLKVGSGDSDTGNFGILALIGSGTNNYEDALENGYQEELKVGDVIYTESGNKIGNTPTIINNKAANSCTISDRDCERILLVPVYKPYIDDGGKIKQVKITGFAYFYVLEFVSDGLGKGSIKGKFIKRTGTGFTTAGAVDKGAYSIKLME